MVCSTHDFNLPGLKDNNFFFRQSVRLPGAEPETEDPQPSGASASPVVTSEVRVEAGMMTEARGTSTPPPSLRWARETIGHFTYLVLLFRVENENEAGKDVFTILSNTHNSDEVTPNGNSVVETADADVHVNTDNEEESVQQLHESSPSLEELHIDCSPNTEVCIYMCVQYIYVYEISNSN